MRYIKLRALEVSRIGLGAMGMSHGCTGSGTDEAESIRTVLRALELGVTLIDTAEIYGPYTNEELLGRALKGRREQVVLATKFGLVSHGGDGAWSLDSRPANIRTAVEGSLKRLGTDHIDLYYQHQVDPNTPVEETAGAVKELIAEGKVRAFGLSEAGPDTVRRAHAVQPVTAVQSEYSLWTRGVEERVLPVLRELNIGLVPFSPLGRGFLTGTVRSTDQFDEGDFRRDNPRFTGENFRRNLALAGGHVTGHRGRRHPGTGRAGLAARPGRRHRTDPRHQARQPGRGEHHCRRHHADQRAVPQSQQPAARRRRHPYRGPGADARTLIIRTGRHDPRLEYYPLMRAAVMYGAGDVRVEDRPDPKVVQPTDVVVRTLAACVCGSDLWPYASMPATDPGRPMGHEFLGVVEETGADVTGLKAGDLVVAPFTYSDNTCDYCAKGLHISCRNGGRYGFDGVDGGQGEAVRVPYADGTLVKLPVAADSTLLPSLLALSDVMTTGHHGAVTAGVSRGDAVLVIGDGAVGLCAVIAAKRLGAERIVLAGRHEARTGLGREFGATDVVAERGDQGIARIRELTGGVDKVIEAVGTRQALDTALRAVRDGGTISRLGVPQHEQWPIGPAAFMRNITLTGGASPARAYIPELLTDVLDGTITPGRVFDQNFTLDQTPDAYRAMADRQVLKALIRP